MNITSRKRLKWLCFLVVLASVIFFATVGREPLSKGLEWLRQTGPVPFFAVMAFCIALGVPATPFLLAAGAAFGFATNLVGVAVALTLSLAFHYPFANRLFKKQLDEFLQKKAGSINHVLRQNTASAIVLVRLTPGFPFILQNCFLSAVCPNFILFLVASLPPLLFSAMLYTALGGGLVRANVTLLVVPAFLLVAVVAAMRHFVLKRRS